MSYLCALLHRCPHTPRRLLPFAPVATSSSLRLPVTRCLRAPRRLPYRHGIAPLDALEASRPRLSCARTLLQQMAGRHAAPFAIFRASNHHPFSFPFVSCTRISELFQDWCPILLTRSLPPITHKKTPFLLHASSTNSLLIERKSPEVCLHIAEQAAPFSMTT